MARPYDSKIPIASLKVGPIRHATLPASLVERIEGVAALLSDIDPRPAEEWVEDFQRDMNPEKEVRLWEVMAATYSLFTHGRTLSLEAKHEAFSVILQRSMASAKAVKKSLQLAYLSRADLKEILKRFAQAAAAKEVEI